MNILIPMAGLGSRFRDAGYATIKPLIRVNGKTFIEWSVSSLGLEGQFIFVILEEHRALLEEHLREISPGCQIATVPSLTRGATETCLAAKAYIDNDSPLVITNSDQIFEWDGAAYARFLEETDPDGNVVVFESDTPKNSYIALDEEGRGTRLAEKEVISHHSLVGIHYWRHGRLFVESAEDLISRDIRANNEFYVSLTYNCLIDRGHRITAYHLKETDRYLSVGTPEQLYDYLDHKGLNLVKHSMTNMHRGWFIGDFLPSVHRTSGLEVGYLVHKQGEKWPVHYHEHMKEINYLIRGHMTINNRELRAGDIFVFEKGCLAAPTFHEDCELICVKLPSVPGDKIIL